MQLIRRNKGFGRIKMDPRELKVREFKILDNKNSKGQSVHLSAYLKRTIICILLEFNKIQDSKDCHNVDLLSNHELRAK